MELNKYVIALKTVVQDNSTTNQIRVDPMVEASKRREEKEKERERRVRESQPALTVPLGEAVDQVILTEEDLEDLVDLELIREADQEDRESQMWLGDLGMKPLLTSQLLMALLPNLPLNQLKVLF